MERNGPQVASSKFHLFEICFINLFQRLYPSEVSKEMITYLRCHTSQCHCHVLCFLFEFKEKFIWFLQNPMTTFSILELYFSGFFFFFCSAMAISSSVKNSINRSFFTSFYSANMRKAPVMYQLNPKHAGHRSRISTPVSGSISK